MTRERILQLREKLVKAALNLSDEDAFYCPEFFDVWRVDTDYEVGDRRRDGETLYKCLQAHRSQASWKPSVSPSLWVRIDDPAQEYPEWVQPTGSTDAYRIGAKVSHNNKHWINELDFNTYEPGVYGWREVTEGE